MAKCEICGNDYDVHVFDSFECAIQALAPICSTCGTRILDHGLEKAGAIFCCST